MKQLAFVLSAFVLVACAHDDRPGPLTGVDLAQGQLSRERGEMRVMLYDTVYHGRYALAPQPHAVPQNFSGTRNLARSDLDMDGQGNGRAALTDSQGAPLYCVFQVEPVTLGGSGQCQDREGRLFDLVVR